jgi:TonB family protein
MMINAKQSSKIKLIAYTLLLPLALLFIVVDNLGAIVKQYNTYDIEKSEEVLLVVDEPPTFPGGMGELTRYLNNNVRYPAEAEKKKIQGRVVCAFVINATGTVSNVEVISGVHPLLDSEAQRILNTMPRWNPGKHQGVAVAVQYSVPVTFRIQE